MKTKITNRKKIGTALGFVALAVAILTMVLWFRLVNQVAIPEDRTLFVVAFLTAAGLGVAAFVIGTRWFGGVPHLGNRSRLVSTVHCRNQPPTGC